MWISKKNPLNLNLLILIYNLIFSQGLLSQSIKMEIPERLKRFKRSFESPLSFRKTVALACLGFVFLLYFGPSFLSWLFGYHPRIHGKNF